jgi:ABC-type transport system involved in Fe-S cluster assembly fused permease/ATPase subunit
MMLTYVGCWCSSLPGCLLVVVAMKRVGLHYVPELPPDLNATIAANISFCTAGATQSQMKAAYWAGQVAGFIDNLPKGYETVEGERATGSVAASGSA